MLMLCRSIAQVSEFTNIHPDLGTSSNVKVYENIQTEFTKLFANAKNIVWSKVKKNYLANFNVDDQKYTALFNPRANLIYQISYGKVKNLPTEIRKAIKRIYVEFEITSAIKIEEAGRTIWLIYVEDETTFALARVENKDIEEVQKFTKYMPASAPPTTNSKY